jgi:hypothetical protein
VEESGPSQGVHDAPVGPLGAAVLRSPGHVEKGSAGSDQDEACVFLLGAWLCAVLRNEVVKCQFGCVQRAVEIDFDDAQVWLLRLAP